MCEKVFSSNENVANNKHITIRALRTETRNLISALLNPERHIPNEKGLQRDWHGLAELCGIGGEKIPSLQHSGDPSSKVLELWVEHNKHESTIDMLLLFLEDLDRFDIIYDIAPLLEKDIEYFKENPNGFTVDYPYIDDRDILTTDDFDRKINGLPPQTYDAFVLFANDDIQFATELIETLEKQYNLKLCVKDRDLVGGIIEHDSVIQLITRRCGRLVAVISPAFFASPVHKYLYGVAQVEGIEQRRRKIIPCMIKPCENLPPDFRLFVILDYSRKGAFYNFWEKLYRSIKAVEAAPAVIRDSQALQRSMETLKPKNHVKFNSMVNLNIDEMPLKNDLPEVQEHLKEEETTTSTSDSLASHKEANGTLKKKNSFYKKLKKIIVPKPMKNNDNESDDKRTPEINIVKSKKKIWKNVKAKIAVTS